MKILTFNVFAVMALLVVRTESSINPLLISQTQAHQISLLVTKTIKFVVTLVLKCAKTKRGKTMPGAQ